MPKQDEEPGLYFDVPPLAVEVYFGAGFKSQTGNLCRAMTSAQLTSVCNINALIERFSRGERLSTESFRQEGPGYAFRSGAVRFYGVYSAAKPGTFVLSHTIIKKQQKLAQSDADEMKRCLSKFDAWWHDRKHSQ